MSKDRDRYIIHLGKKLDKLDNEVVRAGVVAVVRGQPDRIANALLNYVVKAHRLAWRVGEQEIRAAREDVVGRSYGLLDWLKTPDPGEFKLSAYYRQYLLELAGVAVKQILLKASEKLAEAEDEGEPVKDAAERLKTVLKNVTEWRLPVIVRTEGTRVASAARRDLAVAASEVGPGPHWMIYTAILDDRTTRTCHFAHNHKRPVDPSDPLWLEIPPPAHYNCRSMERYGFEWYEDDQKIPDWDKEALNAFRTIRAHEFPKWHPRPLPPPKEPLFELR